MQIHTACIIIPLILHLNSFEAHLESGQNKNNFQAYLKKTFSVLKNEKLSRNMRSLLHSLKRDDLRRKYSMRRKKQVLISNNLKENPLFILKEEKPDVQSQKLTNFLANPLFANNYGQYRTRASNSINGFDLNTIDKTDAQIVGALLYPSTSSVNSVAQSSEPTDESSTEDPLAQLPSTGVNNNLLDSTTSNDAAHQLGFYYNNDYMKNYLQNVQMVPIYPVSANPPKNPPVDSPEGVGENPKRCSSQDFETSQREGIYDIFSEIYKNLKLNYIVTTTPSETSNCASNSINLVNPKYGTANKPIGEKTDNNSENRYNNLLSPEVMDSIVNSIKGIVENQNKKLNKCNSNLPKSYQNVLTPQLMALILNSLSNSITPKQSSVQNFNPNDYLDQFIFKSTSEKSLSEENYLQKLSRFDLTRQIKNNNFDLDLNSLLLNDPEKYKEFVDTNSPKLFETKLKSNSGRVERSTTLKQKVKAKNVIPASNDFGKLHIIQPKLSIFSNLNFPKRCDNSSGENHNNSKIKQKEAFNTSSAIEEILKIVQEMRNKEKQLNEDINCNIVGSWSSIAGGMLLNVTKSEEILDVALNEKSPPSKKGFLLDTGWIIKGVQPIPKTNLIILTGTNLNTKHVVVFIGECRVCGGSELVTGNWLIGRCSHNCQDQKASQDLLSDVWRREMLTKLCHDRLNAISKFATSKKIESATTSHNVSHAAATTAISTKEISMTTDEISTSNTTGTANSSNTEEVCSDQPSNATTSVQSMEENGQNQAANAATSASGMEETSQNQSANATTASAMEETCQNETTADQKLESTCKTANESETKTQKSETTCATEEDLNFLFSNSNSPTTTGSGEMGASTEKGKQSILGNIENNNSSQCAEPANKMTTSVGNGKSTKNGAAKKTQSDNKIFSLCNYNNKAATTRKHHEKKKKTTKIKCTTTPSTTTCEPSTTEPSTTECPSSPSTSAEESTKTNDTNKCMVELDIDTATATAKPKFLNKVIHIFKSKSKTTTEKC